MNLKDDFSQTTAASRKSATERQKQRRPWSTVTYFLLRRNLAPSNMEAALETIGRTTTVTGNGCNSIMLSSGLRFSFVVAGKDGNAYQKRMAGPDVGVDRSARPRCYRYLSWCLHCAVEGPIENERLIK